MQTERNNVKKVMDDVSIVVDCHDFVKENVNKETTV